MEVNTDGDGYFTAMELAEGYYVIAVNTVKNGRISQTALGISSERVPVKAANKQDRNYHDQG